MAGQGPVSRDEPPAGGFVAARRQLLYSRRFARSLVNEFGRASAYLALFSQIGITFFVATVAGVLLGWWIDQQLGTLPIFAVIGSLAGFGLGGLAVARLIRRFLERFEQPNKP